MLMNFNWVVLAVLICEVLIISIGIYAWMHRSTNGSRTFSVFMFSMAIYTFGYAMELASPNLKNMLFWNAIQYIGILSFPTIYLAFVFQYIGRDQWLTTRNMLLMAIIPAVFMIFKLLDGNLHLIYASAGIDTDNAVPLLSFVKGPLYWIIVAYNLIILTAANILIIWKRRTASVLFRNQTNFVLLAAVTIYVLYGIYQSGVPLIPSLKQLDLNPFAYTLWGIGVSFAIFRFQMFELAPIARDTLIEKLHDGVIVLDDRFRVVDANPEAMKVLGWSRPPVGAFAGTFLSEWMKPARLNSVEKSTKFETSRSRDGVEVFYEVNISTLFKNGREKIGYIIVTHDISERKKIENQLHELSLNDELTGLTNRRGFKLLGDQLIQTAKRVKLNIACLYLDLDGLKWINDNLGHMTGDQALMDTARILRESFRSSDIIARLGGDEFIVLAIEAADHTGESMRLRLNENLVAHNSQSDRKFKLSFSVGLAHLRWDDSKSMDTLLAEADKTMYDNKQLKKKAGSYRQ